MFFINIDVIKKLETRANNLEDIRKELRPPHNVGVYVLKNGKDVLYVGMSTSIVSRNNAMRRITYQYLEEGVK